MSREIFVDRVKTPVGTFQIAATERGVSQISFPTRHRVSLEHNKIPRQVKTAFNTTKRFLRSFFSGQGYQHIKIPIDWTEVNPFDRRVLGVIRKTLPGRVVSYRHLARQAGNPRGARAVGNALNRNPIPILIPCHRVVRSNGSLGGFRQGVRWKKRLLDLEQRKRPR